MNEKSNTETKINVEMETARLENAITTLHEAAAGVTAVNAEAIVLEAELQTIRGILTAAGVCSEERYQAQFADNVSEAVAKLAESGMIDLASINANDGVSED